MITRDILSTQLFTESFVEVWETLPNVLMMTKLKTTNKYLVKYLTHVFLCLNFSIF